MGTPSAKEETYEAVFYRDFHVAFHKPKKDLRDECQAFENILHRTDEQKKKKKKTSSSPEAQGQSLKLQR